MRENVIYTTNIYELLSDEEIDAIDAIDEIDIDWYARENRENFEWMLTAYERKYKPAGILVNCDYGFWSGRKKEFYTLDMRKVDLDAMIDAIDGRDIYEYEFTREGDNLNARAIHHDATNYFTVYTVTRRGLEYIDLHFFKGDKSNDEIWDYLIEKRYAKPFFSGNRKLA